MVSPFGRGFDSLQLHKKRSPNGGLRPGNKKGPRKRPFFIIGNLRLETAEATELAHVKFLYLNTSGNLEHRSVNCLLLELLAGLAESTEI